MTADTNPLTAYETGEPGRTIVALAWPTGRPIYPYTADELAAGVDVYTRRLKAGTAKAGDTHARWP
jgi:hypothetical protein